MKDLEMEPVSMNVCLWNTEIQQDNVYAILAILKILASANPSTVLLEHFGIQPEKIVFLFVMHSKSM